MLSVKSQQVHTQNRFCELNEYAATKPNLTYAMMFNQRTNPLYIRLKEIVSSGELGKCAAPIDHYYMVETTGLL